MGGLPVFYCLGRSKDRATAAGFLGMLTVLGAQMNLNEILVGLHRLLDLEDLPETTRFGVVFVVDENEEAEMAALRMR